MSVLPLAAFASPTASGERDDCKKAWRDLIWRNQSLKDKGLVNEWRTRSATCADKNLQTMRLALLSLEVGDPDGAAKTIALLPAESKERAHVTAVKEMQEAERSGAFNPQQFAVRFEDIGHRFDNWFVPLETAGTLWFKGGNYQRAYDLSRELPPSDATLRINAISAAHMHKDLEAVNVGSAALKANPNLYADQDLLIAIAGAFFRQGEYKAATGALTRLLRANPQAANTPEFQTLFHALEQKKP